jgi:hypothetical protein
LTLRIGDEAFGDLVGGFESRFYRSIQARAFSSAWIERWDGVG